MFFLIFIAFSALEMGMPIFGLFLLVVAFLVIGYDPVSKKIWKNKK